MPSIDPRPLLRSAFSLNVLTCRRGTSEHGSTRGYRLSAHRLAHAPGVGRTRGKKTGVRWSRFAARTSGNVESVLACDTYDQREGADTRVVDAVGSARAPSPAAPVVGHAGGVPPMSPGALSTVWPARPSTVLRPGSGPRPWARTAACRRTPAAGASSAAQRTSSVSASRCAACTDRLRATARIGVRRQSRG